MIPLLIGQSNQRGWLRAGFIAGAFVFASVLPSVAVPLLPGDSTAIAGTPGAAGSVISDATRPFEIRNGTGQLLVSGNVQDRVVRLTSTGYLSFEPRIRDLVVTALGTGYYILGLKLTGYEDTTTDVGYSNTGSGTVGPNNASRDISGDEVTFLYPSSTLLPPSSSRFCFIETNAPGYHLGGRITITARNAALETFSTMIEGTAAPARLQVYSGGVIQAAIDAASPGETVVVHAGTYTESITLRAEINVKGDNAGLVTLRPPTDPGVLINSCTGTEFSGFTVTPAVGSSATTGIQVNSGSPLVKNNIVSGFSRQGIAVYSGSTALVCGNQVQNNGASGNGYLDYGILSLSSKPLISNNLITGNECGCYIGWHESDGAQFVNNTVVGNTDDGLWCYQSNPVVKNNIVTGNLEGIHASFASATPVLTYNNVWNNTYGNYTASNTGVINIGIGSLSVDPQFDSASPGNYRLALTSPCRDAGDPAAIYNDLDGSRNDMGWVGGPCASPEGTAAPFGGFLFTSVGNIPANYIPTATGLATVPPGDATALRIPAWDHVPFGAQPYLFGVFGSGVNPNYYTIECKAHGAAESSFAPLDHPLSKVKYTITPDGFTAAVESVGPIWDSGVPYYYNTVNGGSVYWSNDSLRLILNSLQLADGTYDFRVKAFAWGFMPVSLTGTANSLTLTINNKAPTVEILSIARENGSFISDCGIVNLTGPQENLCFQITASHPDGFLDEYKLQAFRGRNLNVGVIASDSHALNHSGQPSWTGVTDSPVYTLPAMFATPPLLSWQTCAYQFHLSAWARTTNGYGRIYYSEFFWNLALNRNPADLDGDGDVDGDDLNIFAGAYGSSINIFAR